MHFKTNLWTSRNYRFFFYESYETNVKKMFLTWSTSMHRTFQCLLHSRMYADTLNRAFRLVLRSSFVFANNNCYWLKYITWFILANNSFSLQKVNENQTTSRKALVYRRKYIVWYIVYLYIQKQDWKTCQIYDKVLRCTIHKLNTI